MHRVVLLGAAFVFGIYASPLAAQDSAPDRAGQQQAPEASPPPAEPLPPPFPPMLRAHHRWVDVGSHHSRRVAHRSTSSHQRRTHAHHRARHSHQRVTHLSRATIRFCHKLSYRQIMRHSNCRTLMRQELAAAEHHHRHSAHRHRSGVHHHSMRHRKR